MNNIFNYVTRSDATNRKLIDGVNCSPESALEEFRFVKKQFGKDAMQNDPTRSGTRYLFEKYINPGWTGYSWNTELFPDYRAFLNELNEMGHKVTLNLHPAEGVRWFEDMYEEFAKTDYAPKLKWLKDDRGKSQNHPTYQQRVPLE